ncbi:MAG TPA: ABC transporter permease, partial [Flavisolibacter sp.]|nr:ABC transporter permease [Flavisolibacter sp.]
MKFTDSIALAFRTVCSNPVRTGITVAIIAFGIMALVGIITAIQAMNQKMTESFSTMGANSFSIRYKERNIRFGNKRNDLELSDRKKRTDKFSKLDQPITGTEAEMFTAAYEFPAIVSISNSAGGRNLIAYGSKKTNPNVYVFGGDQHYVDLNGFNLEAGRNFSSTEIMNGANVCIIGSDVAGKLFNEGGFVALEKNVEINDVNYKIIGVLASRGSSFVFSRDNIVIIPYKNLHRNFSSRSFTIGIKATAIHQVENAIGEAEGVFRSVRKLNITDESNFIIDRSNSIAEKAMNSIRFLTIAVVLIGLITLIGAAIGLMNIMLVSVAERTKEIGLVKAIGARSRDIRNQFLIEAVLI